ncbi:hypothetical protein [Helicobacter cinaedi]|uniref:hypothetical protein n=1 Tax=Helicobacter cinaedi TaxID=213 RepID=UPI000CF04BAB|nr:hypothetical protein [Helicobacter cinaedi]QOQ95463.1 hypothetical protein HW245_07345 [Helicobacter cinaedi]
MSDKIEIIIKPENEVDKQEVETLIRVLKKADIADNAIVMLKEMEQEQDEAKIKALQEKSQEKKEQDDPFHQKDIQSFKDKVDSFGNLTTIAEQSEKLKHIVKPFRFILTRVSNQLLAVDALIEYQKTGDGLKVVLKVGATIVADRIFQIGVVASAGIAITAFIATAIASVSIVGAVVVGIAIFIGGVAISWWISKQVEKLVNYVGGFMIDYIREADFYFTEQEMQQLSVAHCHKTTQRIMQRFSGNYNHKETFINGIDMTDKLYPNPYILSDKAIIPRGFSNTWRNLTTKQLKELNDTIKISEEIK